MRVLHILLLRNNFAEDQRSLINSCRLPPGGCLDRSVT